MPIEAVSPSPEMPMPMERRVRDERARGGGGHAAVDAVEAPGAVQEVGRRLRRAADARELRDSVRRNAHLVEGVDDLLRDDVVAAAEAERRLLALVVGLREAEAVRLRSRRGGRGVRGRAHASSPPFSRPSVRPGTRERRSGLRRSRSSRRAGSPLYWRMETKRVASSGKLVAQDRDELPVAVLLDDVDPVVPPQPVTRFGRERQGPEAAVVERRRRRSLASLSRASVAP